jgi:hypothetical protein
MLTATIGFFDCQICVDFYLVPDWKMSSIPLLSRVYVLCPGCQNTIQVCAVEIDTVHNTPIDFRPQAIVMKIEPPIPNREFRRDGDLAIRIMRKRREREGDFQINLARKQ